MKATKRSCVRAVFSTFLFVWKLEAGRTSSLELNSVMSSPTLAASPTAALKTDNTSVVPSSSLVTAHTNGTVFSTNSTAVSPSNVTGNISLASSYSVVASYMSSQPTSSSLSVLAVTPLAPIFFSSTQEPDDVMSTVSGLLSSSLPQPLTTVFSTSLIPTSSVLSLTPTPTPTSSTPTSPTPTPSPPSLPPLVFPPPENFQLVEKGLEQFTVEWKKPMGIDSRINLTEYALEYEETNRSVNDGANITIPVTFGGEELSNYTVRAGVKRATSYTVRIQAVYSTGQASNFTRNTTLLFRTDSNDPPQHIQITANSTGFLIVWMPPQLPADHSPVIGYQLSHVAVGANIAPTVRVVNVTVNESSLTQFVYNLSPYTEYNISIRTETKFGFGPPANRVNRTRTGAPSSPANVSAQAVSSSTINVTWSQSTSINGPPNGIRYIVTHEQLTNGPQWESQLVSTLTYKIVNLQANTKYRIWIVALNLDNDQQLIGDKSQAVEATTQKTAPPNPSVPTPSRKDSRILMLQGVVQTSGGPVSHYEVIVTKEILLSNGSYQMYANPTGVEPMDVKNYSQAHSLEESAVYLAAVYGANSLSKDFVLGDGRYTAYMTLTPLRNRTGHNGPLQKDLGYQVFVRVYTETGTRRTDRLLFSSSGLSNRIFAPGIDSGSESNSQAAATAVGVVVTIVALCVLVGVMLVYMKKRGILRKLSRKQSRRSFRENGKDVNGIGLTAANRHAIGFLEHTFVRTNSSSSVVETSVKIERFPQHVRNMHMHSDIAFSEEYERIGSESKHYVSAASINPANEAKNRYGNIYAFDHSRVRLKANEEIEGSDYINANFITGFEKEREYIAAQGPVPVTVGDFWRMTWEYNCKTIVMVTNLRERGRIKCDQYWPDDGKQEFGEFLVALTDVADLSSYVIRTFKVWQLKSDDPEYVGGCRIIRQFHFTVWPDHGVPEQASPLLSFVRRIRNQVEEDDGPLLVHCSAGVGRTGTFIALDVGLQQMELRDEIDVRSVVARMRTERNLMVQTEAQYIFIYDALKEAVDFGITEVSASDFSDHFDSLQTIDPMSGKSGFAHEFEKLSKDPPPPLQYCAGNREVNAMKNRNPDIVPIEKTRVLLRKSPGVDGSDYINASFVNDYRTANAYIATQSPLAVTMEDFWKMVWEHGSSTIVMLSTLEEERQLRYWPSKKNASFANYRVELLSCQEYGTYSRRDFNLSSTGYDYTRTVRHFQLQVWPPDVEPDSDVGVAILDLIHQVEAWQKMAPEGPVVVHCDYGVGRTGVFCALSSLTKRINAEGVVDVFQAVRALRSQRPYMIQSVLLYEFVYKVLASFIESFDPYSNFKKSDSCSN